MQRLEYLLGIQRARQSAGTRAAQDVKAKPNKLPILSTLIIRHLDYRSCAYWPILSAKITIHTRFLT